MGLNMAMNWIGFLLKNGLGWGFCLALCWPLNLAAQPLTPILLEGDNAIGIEAAQLFIDETAALKIQDVRSSDFDSRWTVHDDGTVNLGYSNSALWLKFNVRGDRYL